jgi:predicted molibdopterin-dependent oxidoreductase YjgC
MGENSAQSEADINRTRRLLSGLDFMVVQDILFTKT